MADDLRPFDLKQMTEEQYAAHKAKMRRDLLGLSSRYHEPGQSTIPLPPDPNGTIPTTVRPLSSQQYRQAKEDALKLLRGHGGHRTTPKE